MGRAGPRRAEGSPGRAGPPVGGRAAWAGPCYSGGGRLSPREQTSVEKKRRLTELQCTAVTVTVPYKSRVHGEVCDGHYSLQRQWNESPNPAARRILGPARRGPGTKIGLAGSEWDGPAHPGFSGSSSPIFLLVLFIQATHHPTHSRCRTVLFRMLFAVHTMHGHKDELKPAIWSHANHRIT